jgi:hypothetical protein
MTYRKWKYFGKNDVGTELLSFNGLFYFNWQATWHVGNAIIPGNW